MKTSQINRVHFLFPLAGIVTSFLLGDVFLYINTGKIFANLLLTKFIGESLMLCIFTIITLYFVHYTIEYFNQKFYGRTNHSYRFFQEIIFIMLAGFFIQEVFRQVFIFFMVRPENDPAFLEKKLRQFQLINLTFLLVIYSFMTSLRIFRYLQQKQLELARWHREYTQSQFEVLKNQLNPHFLFNSLSVLTSLVYVDAGKAERFIEKLSKTYRYLLEQKDKETVSLSKELEFLDAYLFLTDQRFGKKLKVVIGINGDSASWALPPHSLIIAMEFIIANNTMSLAHPLQISLSIMQDYLHIEYSYQLKNQIEANSRDQLYNLQERYNYLTAPRRMKVETDADLGVIKYPLIKSHEQASTL